MLHATFLAAFDELGGQRWLVAQARKDPRTFIRAVSKLLPREATIHADKPLIFRHPDLTAPGQDAARKVVEASRRLAEAAPLE